MTQERPCVAILGGGQLARMLALAGHRFGVQTRVLDPAVDACAAGVATHIRSDYLNEGVIHVFLEGADVLTYEFENIPAIALPYIEQTCAKLNLPIRPGLQALKIAQDRVHEKEFAAQLGCSVAEWIPFDRPERLPEAFRTFCERAGRDERSAIIKTRTFGYDGKGQQRIRTLEEARTVARELRGTGFILEEVVPFEREWSQISVRGIDGSIRHYPMTENRHDQGILRVSRADHDSMRPPLEATARKIMERFLAKLEYVGVLAIEFFEHEGGLLFNEMAPRVHNSGHWTIDAAECSQFENHIRAMIGFPLGNTDATGYAGMVNLIGDWPTLERLKELPPIGAPHLYGKKLRDSRKVGHFTLNARTREAREAWIDQIIRVCRELRNGAMEPSQ